jgi:hypothetical protein
MGLRCSRLLGCTSIADEFCGNPSDNSIGWRIADHYGAGGDYRAGADLDTLEHNRVGADPDIFSDGDGRTRANLRAHSFT